MKHKPYDEDELICDIVEAKLPMTHVARKHGLSPTHLHDILGGRLRPNILARIAKLWGLTRHDIRRTCAASVKDMLDIHIETGRSEKGHNARHCREYVMNRALREEDFRLEEPVAPPRSGTPAGRWRALRKVIETCAKRGQNDQ